ncbi:extracellular solute-binding protein [Paenibacillus sp. NPDC093718]|uniref:extracellular solute-binding protein n=1 Tax=Paenibacillus sp. NPDC093718 TaxID=3390601 RepID=UPI003D079C0B
MSKRKIMSMFMALLFIAALMAGCTGNSTNSSKEPSPTDEGTSPNQNAAGSYPDYSQGFPERVTMEIPVYERAFEGWNVTDNYYTRWIQKEFGDKYNIEVKFTPIARTNEVTTYQQLLAAGKAPDIIFHYDMPQALAYYGEGVMQELDWKEIEHYAPTYWSNMSETIQQYGVVDGKNTFFFGKRPDLNNYGNFVNIIRKDWVEKVGMKVEDLTSLEKYNEMLMKWKEAGIGVAGAGLTRNVFNYSYGFRDWPTDPKVHALYADLSVADFTTSATEGWLRNLSYQYHNGLIDKEFYLRDDDNKLKAEFVAGNTGTYGLYITNNTDVFEATLKNNPGAEFAVIPPGTGVPEGNVPQGRADWTFGLIMGINHASTTEERAAVWMYLEWMSQPENLMFLQNGVEGENYKLDSDGLPVKDPDFKGESVLSQNNNKDYWALITEAPTFETPELTLKANKNNWTPAGYEQIVEDMIKYRQEIKPYQIQDPLFTVVLEKVNEYKADLNNLFQELYLDIVLAPEDQFDAKYEAAKQKFLDAGYQEILDEKQKAIDAGQFR